MALSIKNKLVEEQVRNLCSLTGESVTQAILSAVEHRLKSLGNRTRGSGLASALLEIGKECSSLPDLDARTPDEILGYGKDGF